MKLTRANNMAAEVNNLLDEEEQNQEVYCNIARKEAEILLNAKIEKLKIKNPRFNQIALNLRSTELHLNALKKMKKNKTPLLNPNKILLIKPI